MAVGKPVIGVINGNCPAFIESNNIGYSCSSGDSYRLVNLIKNLKISKLVNIDKHSKEI